MRQTDTTYRNAIKLYKSLKLPATVLNVVDELLPHEQAWNILLGIRGTGKTTQLIIWGMCLNQTNGIQIQYIRQRETQITPMHISKLCAVIVDNGYIEKITNGRYNNVYYHSRRWYYSTVDETGNIIDKSEEAFMVCLAIDLSENYKSSYNAPKGDFIIVDEFLSERGYLPDEFIKLSHLLSTIIRLRDTAHIYLSGNLIDKYSPYFDELQLNDVISQITFGDHVQLQCSGTKLHVYAQPRPTDKKRETVNSRYFGWKSQKLTAITGTKGMWSIKMYPRPPKGDFTVLSKAYFYKNGKYLARELRRSETMTYLFCYIDDGYDEKIHILYTCDSETGYNNKVRYGLGYTQTDAYIKKLIIAERVYFADNSAGALFDAYLRDIKTKGRKE